MKSFRKWRRSVLLTFSLGWGFIDFPSVFSASERGEFEHVCCLVIWLRLQAKNSNAHFIISSTHSICSRSVCVFDIFLFCAGGDPFGLVNWYEGSCGKIGGVGRFSFEKIFCLFFFRYFWTLKEKLKLDLSSSGTFWFRQAQATKGVRFIFLFSFLCWSVSRQPNRL